MYKKEGVGLEDSELRRDAIIVIGVVRGLVLVVRFYKDTDRLIKRETVHVLED